MDNSGNNTDSDVIQDDYKFEYGGLEPDYIPNISPDNQEVIKIFQETTYMRDFFRNDNSMDDKLSYPELVSNKLKRPHLKSIDSEADNNENNASCATEDNYRFLIEDKGEKKD